MLLSVIDVSRSRVESEREIVEHIESVLECLPAERLMLAPDCGLGLLPVDLAKQKLSNMVSAVKQVRSKLASQDGHRL